jgi:hypothetical protein
MGRAVKGYPGAKAGAGVYQRIINEMPPHRVYVEPFIGSGAVLLRKRPASCSIVMDADAEVAARWSTIARSGAAGSLIVMRGDARSLIAGLDVARDRQTLIYCDPPYVRAARRSSADLYRHEMSDGDHAELLALLRSLPCAVMVSGYRHPLYDAELARWRRLDYSTMTRGGPAVESLWCNFTAEDRHEFTYQGDTFRERERVRRKRARWRARLAAMPRLERRAMLADLAALESASPGLTLLERADPLAIPGDEDLRALSPGLAMPARARIAEAGDAYVGAPAGIASAGEPAGGSPSSPSPALVHVAPGAILARPGA